MNGSSGRGQGGGGRGMGSGGKGGSGRGMGRGGGRGRNNGGSLGVGGDCVCAKCNTKIPHQRGVKCTDLKCPNCGNTMVRDELLNR